jgi:hypothetical protein
MLGGFVGAIPLLQKEDEGYGDLFVDAQLERRLSPANPKRVTSVTIEGDIKG